ncbi:hypothetical protein E4U55_002227 [Claviceps digitariae]|nr:hypothetical protein E4U55_002227 [Claviceps digitariae]
MEQNFRRLLPRRSTSPLNNSNEGAECTYITDSGETRFSALRRRYSSHKEELDSLKKLLYHIRTSSPEEVDKIILHVRSYEDPIEAFNSYFSSSEGQEGQSLTTDTIQETDGLSELHIDPQLGSMSEAWHMVGISVPAESFVWTTIAPVDVVNHLISQYFILERPVLLPSIHYQSFTDEMNEGDVTSEIHCSDLLVNAICAHQCFLSQEYTQGSVTRRDLGRRFLDECYRLLRLRSGRVTLPTAQAVTLIYQAELAEQVFNIPPSM